MSVGDKVIIINNEENAGYKEFFGKIGVITDEQRLKGRQRSYFRVSFDRGLTFSSSYIDVGDWRLKLANENRRFS